MMSTPRRRRPARTPRQQRRAGPRRRVVAATPEYRIARSRRRIENRNCFFTSSAVTTSASMPFSRLARRVARYRACPGECAEVVDTALAEHDVVVQVLAETLPKFERLLVEQCCFGPEIVGANDRGVASGIAAADPAFLQHRDIREPMLFGQVVGGRQSMPAATDDDDIVFTCGSGIATTRASCQWPSALCSRLKDEYRFIATNGSARGSAGRLRSCSNQPG